MNFEVNPAIEPSKIDALARELDAAEGVAEESTDTDVDTITRIGRACLKEEAPMQCRQLVVLQRHPKSRRGGSCRTVLIQQGLFVGGTSSRRP